MATAGPEHAPRPNLETLQKAIQYGEIEKAKLIVSQLAEQKALLNIAPKETEAAGEIDVKICPEDKTNSYGFRIWKVHPSSSIKFLKERFEREYKIPQEVQKWIIGKVIRTNWETLAGCGVSSSGACIHVYIIPAQQAGLGSRQEYESRRQREQHEPMYDEPARVYRPVERNSPRTRADAAEEPGGLELRLDMDPTPPPPKPRPFLEDPLPSISQIGWACPQCTFMNEPTRPGCIMCSADRPADYVAPAGPYKISDEEKQRLAKQEEDERLAIELSEEGDGQSLAFQMHIDPLLQAQTEVLLNRVPDYTQGRDERINTIDGGEIDSMIIEQLMQDQLEGERNTTDIPESINPIFAGGRLTRVLEINDTGPDVEYGSLQN